MHNGDKTQKSWKPLLNTIFVLEAHWNVWGEGEDPKTFWGN